MRRFARGFLVVGASLTVLSAAAISDPSSPVGWDDWTADPWSRGLLAGLVVTAAGMLLGILSTRVSLRADRIVSRVLTALLAAILGFVLFIPFMVVTQCDAAVGGCRTRGWSTVLGFGFSGDPTFLLAVAAALMAGTAAWRLSGRTKKSFG